jgi:hypothetical protein
MFELSQESAASAPFVLEGFVLDPEGEPAAGAVVVTSAGGQAVVDEKGSWRLEISVPIDVVSASR